jgi:hypothetical protein
MSKCDKCWDNPCLCGEQYKHLSPKKIAELIEALKPMAAEVVETVLQPSDEEEAAVEDKINAIVKEALNAASMKQIVVEADFFDTDERGLKKISQLYEVAVLGHVIIVVLPRTYSSGEKSRPYIKLTCNPTWLTLCVHFNKMALVTKDRGHYFFEGFEKVPEAEEAAYRIVANKALGPAPEYSKDYPIYTFLRGS